MDIWGDVHTGVLLEERSRLTAKRARKALQGPGVVVSLELGRTGSGQVYPGYGPEVNSRKCMQGPTHGQP